MGKIAELIETLDYGPSPESDDAVRGWLASKHEGFGHFIGGRFTKPADLFDVFNPATGEQIARVSQGSEADVAAAVAAARKALSGWSALPGDARARHLYALARHVQKRERFLSVLETIDNGKPIRETRDIDIPLVARHFYHHAGWALADCERISRLETGRRLRADHSLEFPAADARLEDRAGAGGRKYGGAEARRIHPADRARLRRNLRRSRPAARASSISSPATARPAPHSSRMPDVDKIAFTGSTEVGRVIRKATAGTGKKLSLELGGKSPFVVFEDADLDSAVEGVVDAIWFNQGQVCCAGSRLLVAESVAEKFLRKLRARMATLRVGDPLDKSTDIGAIVAPVQLERIRRLVEAGRAEGAEICSPTAALPEARLLLSADPPDGRRARFAAGARGDLRPGAGRDDVPHARRSGRARQQYALRPCGSRLDREHQPRPRSRRAHQGRRRLDQFDQHVRRGVGLRRLSRERLRPRGRPRGPCRISRHRRRAAWRRGQRREGAKLERRAGPAAAASGIDRTAKIYVGGKQARPDSGYSYSVLDPKGRSLGQAGLGNRKDIRNAVEAASKADGWGAATAHNRAQVLYLCRRES